VADRRASQTNDASDKQIHSAVRHGRMVRFHVFGDPDPIEGYVVGMDRYTYVVLERIDFGLQFEYCIIHKASASPIRLAKDATLDAESDEVQAEAAPFRKWVRQNIFNDKS
jgi:hypothetical protein